MGCIKETRQLQNSTFRDRTLPSPLFPTPHSPPKSPRKVSKIALYLQTPASARAGPCSSFSPSGPRAAARRGPGTAGSWREARARQQEQLQHLPRPANSFCSPPPPPEFRVGLQNAATR